MTRKPPILIATLLALGIVLVQALLVPLFAGPATHLEPRDLPVVVAVEPGQPPAFAQQLSAAKPGAFEITTVANAAAADQALRDREAYAAFIVGPDGVSLHTASAAAPIVAQLLTQAAAQLGGGKPVPVTDVVATTPDDPRGAGFAAGFLPLALTSMLAGILLIVALRSRLARLIGLLAYAVLTGLMGALVLQSWLGVLPAAYGANALALGLFALAAAGLVAGLGSLLGRAGLGLGALLVFLVGNPLSAVGAAPELLPQPWGAVGQWLPIGAGATLLRSAAFFDWAGAGHALWVLGGTAVLGLAFVLIGRSGTDSSTDSRAATEPPSEADPAARDAARRLGAAASA